MALDFISKKASGDAPFFLMVSYGTPHDPWAKNNVPAQYCDRFKDVEFPLPPNYSDQMDPYGDEWSNIRKGPREIDEWMRNYYAMTANLDWNIGRILDAADKAGLAGLGSQIPEAVEGMDLSRAALGKSSPEPEAALLMNTGACALWEDGHEWRALRDKRFTCAVFRGGGPKNLPRREVLFDDEADPLQMTDLANDPAHKTHREKCRARLKAKMAQLNDEFPASTWYRDHWTDGKRRIIASAQGPFPNESSD